MSKQKQKGTWFETKVCEYLKEKLGLPIERRTLAGINDKGDIAGVKTKDGKDIVIECKNHKTYQLTEWLREARAEGKNAECIGVVIFKGNGVGETRMGDQFVLLGLKEFTELIG